MDSISHCVVFVCVCVTCPVQRPTTRSAMKVSSVSPERWLTITPQPFSWASLHLRDGAGINMMHAAGMYMDVCAPVYASHTHKINSRLDGLCDGANLVHFK